ncbi:hypothetical protein GCM10010273_43300 [Streptomyces lavendulocolor]
MSAGGADGGADGGLEGLAHMGVEFVGDVPVTGHSDAPHPPPLPEVALWPRRHILSNVGASGQGVEPPAGCPAGGSRAPGGAGQ